MLFFVFNQDIVRCLGTFITPFLGALTSGKFHKKLKEGKQNIPPNLSILFFPLVPRFFFD